MPYFNLDLGDEGDIGVWNGTDKSHKPYVSISVDNGWDVAGLDLSAADARRLASELLIAASAAEPLPPHAELPG